MGSAVAAVAAVVVGDGCDGAGEVFLHVWKWMNGNGKGECVFRVREHPLSTQSALPGCQ